MESFPGGGPACKAKASRSRLVIGFLPALLPEIFFVTDFFASDFFADLFFSLRAIYSTCHLILFHNLMVFNDLGKRRLFCILSNEIKNLEADIRRYEPLIALDGGNDGLDLIKKVIYKTKYILKVKGTLALEIGNEQFKKVSKILIERNFKVEHIITDYRDNIRGVISTYIGTKHD